MKFKFDALNNFKIVIETLQLINTRFKIIFFLQEIIVKMYKKKSKNYIKK